MSRFKLVERKFTVFLRTPLSVRSAMAVIVTATLVSVIAGGVLIRFLDSAEFPNVGTGLWWALQTVTTVGYGDVAPQNAIGRLVGAVIMLESIAFIAIVTAAITSSFVERARRAQASPASVEELPGVEQLAAQLADIQTRLDVIQRALDLGGSAGANPAR
jgi:voltage-gated potassium channel